MMGAIAASRRRGSSAGGGGGGGEEPQPGAAADVVSIAADGWQAEWSEAPPALAPDTGAENQHFLLVTRDGFDDTGAPTTHTDRLIATTRVRQPYPNHASLTALAVALSDYVYSTDSIAGVVNNSAEASPKPIANWIMPHRLVVDGELELEVVAFHRDARAGKQVACVVFEASDGTNTAMQTVAAAAVSGRANDRCAVLSYKASLDISSLDPGLITANAKVYPWLGDAAAVLDSGDQAGGREFSPRYFLKNGGAKTLYYVKTAANGGNDGTGAGSTNAATASASPFLTVKAALDKAHADLGGTSGVDMAEIRIGDDGGTPFVLQSSAATRTQKIAAVTITRDPAVAIANARVSFGAAAYFPALGGALAAPIAEGALRFVEVGIVRTGNSYFGATASPKLELTFEDCTWDNGNQNWKWLNNSHDLHFGTTFTNMGTNVPMANVAGSEHRLWRGISCLPSANVTVEPWLVVGSRIANPQFQRGGLTQTGSILAFNHFSGNVSASAGDTEDLVGWAVVQNLFEWTSSSASLAFGVSRDAQTGDNTHVVVHHNTHTGAYLSGRWNVFYDEGATPRTSKLHSVKGNIVVQVNTKGDDFRGINEGGADASTRTGQFAFEHGVGCAGNFAQFVDAGGGADTFRQFYPGLAADIGASTTVRNDPLFTDYKGTTFNGAVYSAGAGGGDYTLQAGSPCEGMVADPVLSHDLAGASRSVNQDTAGAYA